MLTHLFSHVRGGASVRHVPLYIGISYLNTYNPASTVRQDAARQASHPKMFNTFMQNLLSERSERPAVQSPRWTNGWPGPEAPNRARRGR